MSQPVHWLNFRYDRPAVEHTSSYYGRRKTYRPRLKEQYLQANYRFVISPYAPAAHPALYDADTLIDWDYVDQVSLSTSDGTDNHCPICLATPRAAKITRCGHIFCSACILRHLGMYRVRRCPMCYENTCRADLRPVEVVSTQRLEPNRVLEFVLLSRVKGTLTPKRTEPSTNEPWKPEAGETSELWSVLPPVGSDNAIFSRLTAGTLAHETACMSREEQELRDAAQDAKSSGEEEWLPFLEEAMQQFCDRRNKSAARRGQALPAAPPSLTNSPSQGRRAGNGGGSPRSQADPGLRSRSNSVEDEALPPPPHTPPHGLSKSPSSLSVDEHGPSSKSPSSSVDGGAAGGGDTSEEHVVEEREARVPSGEPVSYFFQLSDGQYVFLHPLNMRCLMADAEGQHANLPTRVEGRVLEVEAMTLTPELRSRYNFLKHLPLYSHIQLVELDLKPVLSEATYAHFKAEVKKRQQRRKTRERTEKRNKRDESKSIVGGVGLTDEEIQQIKARRETVNLDGPLPWQALLIGEERDPEKIQQAMQALQTDTTDAGAAEAVEAALKADGSSGGGGNAGLRSFAEITKMNGNYPALVDSFPPLGSTPSEIPQSRPRSGSLSSSPPAPTRSHVATGGGGGRGAAASFWGSPSGLQHSPPPASAPVGVWSAHNVFTNPSSPQQAPVWAARAAVVARAQTQTQSTPQQPSQTSVSTECEGSTIVLQPLRAAQPVLSSLVEDPAANAGTAVVDGASGKKKKRAAVTLFSTGMQRKYST